MKKQQKRKASRGGGKSAADMVMVNERRVLQRSVAHQRTIRKLARQMLREHLKANAALRDVAALISACDTADEAARPSARAVNE